MTSTAIMEDHYELKPVSSVRIAEQERVSRNQVPVDRDAADMAKLGKRQQLNRNFGFMSMVGFATTIMGTWEAVNVSVFIKTSR